MPTPRIVGSRPRYGLAGSLIAVVACRATAPAPAIRNQPVTPQPDAPSAGASSAPVDVTLTPVGRSARAATATARFATAPRVGQPAVVELVLTAVKPEEGLGEFQGLNDEFRTHLEVTVPAGVAIDNADIQVANRYAPHPDVAWTAQAATFRLRVTPTVAGPLPMSADLKFAVCTDQQCWPIRTTMAWTLDVPR